MLTDSEIQTDFVTVTTPRTRNTTKPQPTQNGTAPVTSSAFLSMWNVAVERADRGQSDKVTTGP